MRAAIVEGFNEPVVISDVEPIPLGTHDVRVRTGASGVCHSDLSVVRGQYPSFQLPLILGHEGAGTVEEIGANVSAVRPGDRVIASFVTYCGQCYQCLNNRAHLCEMQRSIGSQTRANRGDEPLIALQGLGTMAEQMTAHEANLVKIETDLPDEQLALVGCGITTGVGAVLWTAQVQPGSSVAIFGCGGVGLSAVQGAYIAGAAQIIAVDPLSAKREAALNFGATHAVDPSAGDPVEQIREITRGRGAEYTFEFVGSVKTMRQVYDAAAVGCTVTYIGSLDATSTLDLPANALHTEGKRILGSTYGSAQVRRDMPRLVALAEANRLDVEAMVSRRLKLDDVNEALDAIDAGETIRSVLVF